VENLFPNEKQERQMKKLLILAIVLTMVAFGTNAGAIPETFGLLGVEDPNLSASVKFTYTPGTATTDTVIDIVIANNSLLAAGPDPRLTAFAFNAFNPATAFTGFTGFPEPFPAPSGWIGFQDLNDINTPGNYGLYDFAGLTGPNFGGGDANDGIPRGETFNFRFILAGVTGLDALTEQSFLNEFSFDAPGNPEEDEQFFIARFQRTGLNMEGSDVATPVDVPEPAAFMLLGPALFGLALLKRRKNSKRTAS
jgi:hypothetical protein